MSAQAQAWQIAAKVERIRQCRMETAGAEHLPTVAALKRYAAALGYRVKVRFANYKRNADTSRRSAQALCRKSWSEQRLASAVYGRR